MDKHNDADNSAAEMSRIIAERDVAKRWKKSIRTLQRWRAGHSGPPWLQIGGSAFYRVVDILAFEEKARRGGPEQ